MSLVSIGFIGLGIMGKPMALNLLRSGYRLVVFDIDPRASSELEEAGAAKAGSPAAVAASADIIITMLPDAPQLREVALGPFGIIYGLNAGKLFIDMSTVDAATEKEIHLHFGEKGVDTLDAPVSGGQVGAINASLSIMVGGTASSFERALPIFNAIGKRITHMGAIGAGQVTKSCSQVATALTTQGVIEAFTLARNAGIDLSKVREALSGGFADSRVLALTGDKIIREDFEPGFKLRLYSKDLRIARETAGSFGIALPGAEMLHNEMEQMIALGHGELDFSALIHVLENSIKKSK